MQIWLNWQRKNVAAGASLSPAQVENLRHQGLVLYLALHGLVGRVQRDIPGA